MKHAHAQSKRACADVYSVYIYVYIYHVKCAYAQLVACACACSSASVHMLNREHACAQLLAFNAQQFQLDILT